MMEEGRSGQIIDAAAAQNEMRAVTATAAVVQGAPVVAVTGTAAVPLRTGGERGRRSKREVEGSLWRWWGAVSKAVAIRDARTEEMRRQLGDLS